MIIKMKSVVAGVALSVIALASSAGEFNESNGVAIKGYDPVAFFKDSKPVRGKDDLRFEYKLRVRHCARLQGRHRSCDIHCHRRSALSELQHTSST